MLHQQIYLSVCVLAVVFVSTTYTTATNFRPLQIREREQTECDLFRRISHVCYQCSKRHEEDFNAMYTSCCSGREADASVREYCEAIHTEPPKRGGLWNYSE